MTLHQRILVAIEHRHPGCLPVLTGLLCCLLVATHAPCAETPEASATNGTVSIHFGTPAGRIKPLHGVNGGPLSRSSESDDLIVYHAEAGFPHTRLHDCQWPSPNVVDVHCVFPLFHADADDPRNYVFAPTDDYLAAIVKNGSQIVYRLGTCIEHKTQYNVNPPADPRKWADICVHLIRHLNEWHYINVGWNESRPNKRESFRGLRTKFQATLGGGAHPVPRHSLGCGQFLYRRRRHAALEHVRRIRGAQHHLPRISRVQRVDPPPRPGARGRSAVARCLRRSERGQAARRSVARQFQIPAEPLGLVTPGTAPDRKGPCQVPPPYLWRCFLLLVDFRVCCGSEDDEATLFGRQTQFDLDLVRRDPNKIKRCDGLGGWIPQFRFPGGLQA